MPIKHYFFQSLYKILLRLYHGQQRESRCAAKHPPLTSDLFPLLGLVWSERQCSRRRWCPLAANYQSVTWFSLYFSAKTEHQLHRHPSEVIIILAFFSLPVTFLSVSVSDGRPSGGTHLTQATEPRQKVRWSVGIICAGRSPSLTPDITSDLFGRVNCSALSGDLSHLMLCWRHESRSIEQIFHNLPWIQMNVSQFTFIFETQVSAQMWHSAHCRDKICCPCCRKKLFIIGELKSSPKWLQATTVTRHLSNLLWVVSKPDEIYQIPSRTFLSSVWF